MRQLTLLLFLVSVAMGRFRGGDGQTSTLCGVIIQQGGAAQSSPLLPDLHQHLCQIWRHDTSPGRSPGVSFSFQPLRLVIGHSGSPADAALLHPSRLGAVHEVEARTEAAILGRGLRLFQAA